MIIYEVSLFIRSSVYSEFYLWLKQHINDMLLFKGFVCAELLKESSSMNENNDIIQLTVRYQVNQMENLNDYLIKHAKKMRNLGLQKFGEQFSATRQIFTHIENFNSQDLTK